MFLPVCVLLPPVDVPLPPPDIFLPMEHPAACSGHISACGVSCRLLRICSCLCAFCCLLLMFLCLLRIYSCLWSILLPAPDISLPMSVLLPAPDISLPVSVLLPAPDISLPVEYPAASSGHISACGVSCRLLRICSCLCAFFISVLLVPLTSSNAFLTLYVPFPLQYNSPCRTSRFHPFPVSEFHSCCPVSNIFRPCPCPFPHP